MLVLSIAIGVIGAVGVVGSVNSVIKSKHKPSQLRGDPASGKVLLRNLKMRHTLAHRNLRDVLVHGNVSGETKNIACLQYDLALRSLTQTFRAKSNNWVIDPEKIVEAQESLNQWYVENQCLMENNLVKMHYDYQLEVLHYMKKGLM